MNMGPTLTRGIVLTTENSSLLLPLVAVVVVIVIVVSVRPVLSHRGEQYQAERQDDLLAASNDRGRVAAILEILVVVAVVLESVAVVLN